MNEGALYVGMDVHKATVALAVAEPGRNGEVRFIGNVPNKAPTVISLLRKLEQKHGTIECAYEAGPCGYSLYRALTAAGLACIVVAPSKIPTSPGHVKNDYRDALSLARLLRSGDDSRLGARAHTRSHARSRQGQTCRGLLEITAGAGRSYEPLWRIKAREDARLRNAAVPPRGAAKARPTHSAWGDLERVLDRSPAPSDRVLAYAMRTFVGWRDATHGVRQETIREEVRR